MLQGVSFEVPEGGVTALLGRNGVGKTTTLRAMLGLVPRRGTRDARRRGADAAARRTQIVRRGVGYVPEDRDVFAGLTVDENLRLSERNGSAALRARLRALPGAAERAAASAPGTLSGGQQQMVAIARALLNENPVLLVDEPTKGLAPLLVTEVAAALERAAELATVLLVEQNLGRRRARRAAGRRARRRPRRPRRPGGRAARATASAIRALLGVHGGGHVSTFVLLTITGLGLGAMYFLIASGLSLIYGLMGVLNFAHGAFLTVGAYATWWMSTQVGGGAGHEAPRRRGRRPRGRRGARRARRARADPAALPPPDRAGARHRRARARARRARRGDLGLRRASRSRCRRG